MKRVICLIMVMILLFCVSCSAAEIAAGSFDEDFSQYADDGSLDLDGYEFNIRFYSYFTPEDTSLFGYRQNTAFQDAVLKRIEETEKAYNCTISHVNSPSQHLESDFTAVLMSGLKYCDALMSCSYNLRPTIEGGFFEPLSQVSDIIDWKDSKKWGNWRLLEQSVWDGEIYGLIPVLWPDVAMSSGYMFVFNEKFAGLLGQPDPREYIENGSWSREKLGEMMLAYTTEDLGYPLRALLTYEGHFLDTALRANNAQTYKLVDGQYVSGYHTPEGLDALTWADDFLHVTYADCVTFYNSDTDGYPRFVREENALFFTSIMNMYGSDATIPFEVEDFCPLPMPNGPDREKENAPYTTFFEWVRSNLFFPVNGDIQAAATVANALFESLDGFDEQGLKDYYLKYYYHDGRDFELVNEVFENSRYSYYSDGMRSLVVEALYGNHSRSVAEILDSSEEAQNERLQKYVVPTVESFGDIFGRDVLGEQ